MIQSRWPTGRAPAVWPDDAAYDAAIRRIIARGAALDERSVYSSPGFPRVTPRSRSGSPTSASTSIPRCSWQFPATYGYPAPALDVDLEKIAAQVLAAAIAEVTGPDEPVTIKSTVVEGNPARALLDASAGAELLVVGSRGHGGFAEALLGSVDQHCVHHATCPVVVIRDAVTGQNARR
jgi:nucleotide-binding universal stress UspA family protein